MVEEDPSVDVDGLWEHDLDRMSLDAQEPPACPPDDHDIMTMQVCRRCGVSWVEAS